ncbi:MAG: zinc-dependent alcohol dehydrogenase family protein [Anaerolineae bacterium]
MQAQIIDEFGPPSVFKKIDIPTPKLQPNHVIIQVKATSVNPVDCKIRSGQVPEIAPHLPAILHGDVAGVIVETGDHVNRFKPGDEVYGCAGGVKGTAGALAEYMLADSDCLAKKPLSLSFSQAAALPLVTITAWTALFLRAEVKASQSLLIHGGVGGVGHIGIQLAKWAGAHVIATVGSDEDVVLAHQLGAREVINFRKETVEDYVARTTSGKGFDVIFDTVGGKNLDLSFKAAALNGTITTTVARGENDLSPMHHKGLSLHVVFMLIPLIHNLHRKQQGQILEKAAKLVDEGHLFPLIDPHVFMIDEVAKAHAYLESGKAKGKIVLTNLFG